MADTGHALMTPRPSVWKLKYVAPELGLDNQRRSLADLQAAFAGGQDFAGIQPALIVKQLA